MAEKIKLKRVRLSFPSIFKKASFEGKETKYEATFLIPKADKKVYKVLKAAIEAEIAEAKIKVPPGRWALQDGDDKEYDGYADHWSLKASSNKRPTVLDRDKSPLTEEDEKLYAGCYVNAVVDFWVQNNSWGKRVNCNLYGVQYVEDGDPFGSGDIDSSDLFDDIDDIDDED